MTATTKRANFDLSPEQEALLANLRVQLAASSTKEAGAELMGVIEARDGSGRRPSTESGRSALTYLLILTYLVTISRGEIHPALQARRRQSVGHGGSVRTTRTAREGAVALGFDLDGMLAVIQALTTADFHKSTTTHADHRVWQDVYRPMTAAGEVYLKLTVIDDVLIVSFKEL